MALAAEFPVPDDRTAGSYQKVERKVGDYATAAAAVQVSLNADGRSDRPAWRCRPPGRAPCASTRPSSCWPDRSRSAELLRAASDAAWHRSAPQADLRGSVEFKKHLAGVLVARGLRLALSRLGVQA